MKAMIFAAGLGSRLGELTRNKPKALITVEGRTLLELAISNLRMHGFNELIVNVHHFADEIIEYLTESKGFGCSVVFSDERDQLLETGGGLKKASWFFDEQPFLIYNVDILTDLNLKSLYDFHLESDAIATLAVRDRKSSRKLMFNQEGILCGWTNLGSGEIRMARAESRTLFSTAFSGIHVLDPKIFNEIQQEGKFSIIETYLDLAQRHNIMAYRQDSGVWLDVGKPGAVEKAEALLQFLPY